MFWILIMVGLFGGFVDSGLGMGYGVTAATVLLTFGMTPALISASVHAAEAVVDGSSAYFHHRYGNVATEMLPYIIVPGMAAAVLGALFLSWLALDIATNWIRGMLILMGLVVLAKHVPKTIHFKELLTKRRAVVLSFIAAFIDISGGGGWGPIMTPALILTGNESRKAIGTVEFTEPFVSAAGVLIFLFTLGPEFLGPFIPLLVGGLITTPLGAQLAGRVPRRPLGILVGSWVIILNIYALLVAFLM